MGGTNSLVCPSKKVDSHCQHVRTNTANRLHAASYFHNLAQTQPVTLSSNSQPLVSIHTRIRFSIDCPQKRLAFTDTHVHKFFFVPNFTFPVILASTSLILATCWNTQSMRLPFPPERKNSKVRSTYVMAKQQPYSQYVTRRRGTQNLPFM